VIGRTWAKAEAAAQKNNRIEIMYFFIYITMMFYKYKIISAE
jgi:hypothetical protein